jgi:hypothetical protein
MLNWQITCITGSEFRVVMSVTISALKRSIFSSYSPPVVCRRAHVVYTLFVFVCVYWSPTHWILLHNFVDHFGLSNVCI